MAASFDTISPVNSAFGSNEMGPAGSFIYRKFWKQIAMPSHYGETPPVDFWYKDLLHGRVDGEGQVVYPSANNLKQIPTDNAETLLALNFVVDAFSDFREHFALALVRDKICAESFITRINARQAWANADAIYRLHMENIYDHLVTSWFQKEQRNAKIKNFSDFLHEFMELVQYGSNKIPFTKSAFILSRYFTPLSSGLIIEIDIVPHSIDITKQEAWIADKNWPFYRGSARNFGFLVDKNAPWRLIADINSPVMMKYMSAYGVTPENLFDTYFYRSHLFDIEYLKRELVRMYNSYIEGYPNAKATKTKLKGAGGVKTVSNLIMRWPTTLDNINKQFRPEFWLKIYYYIRLREIGAPPDAVQFNKKLKKILQAYKSLDFDGALSYIDSNIRRMQVR